MLARVGHRWTLDSCSQCMLDHSRHPFLPKKRETAFAVLDPAAPQTPTLANVVTSYLVLYNPPKPKMHGEFPESSWRGSLKVLKDVIPL